LVLANFGIRTERKADPLPAIVEIPPKNRLGCWDAGDLLPGKIKKIWMATVAR